MKKVVVGAVVATVGIVLAGCSSEPVFEPAPVTVETPAPTTPAPTYTPEPEPVESELRLAKQICNILDEPGMKYIKLYDNDTTAIVDLPDTAPIEGVACVLSYLDMPQRVFTSVSNTTALQGVKTASAQGYELEWTFHPDNGLQMIITETGTF
jgi:hypothetical protein